MGRRLMPHVPAGDGTDKKTGDNFQYGDYPVTLEKCSVCAGVYANLEQHVQTVFHKMSGGR